MSEQPPQPPPEQRAVDPARRIVELIDEGDEAGALAFARALHPAEQADALSGIESEVLALVAAQFSPVELAAVLEFLEPRYRDALALALATDRLALLIREVHDDVAVDLMQALPAEVARELVGGLVRDARSLRELSTYGAETAAGRMTGQSFSVGADFTVAEVIARLREQRPETTQPLYAFVVDRAGRLTGVVSFRALLFAAPTTRVRALMRDVTSVRAETDQEEAARLLKRFNLLALPVVDAENRLLGMLTVDDVIDVLEDEATEDMLRLAGVNEDEALESVRDSVRYRLPWLALNLVALMLAAYVISLFEGTIARVAVIAAFLPVVLGQGGNGGIQTVTVVVRSLAMGRLTTRNTMHVTRNELVTALITGSAIGASVGLLAGLWQQSLWLGVVVGLAVLGNQLVGAVAGVLFPMGLQRLRQDPALSAPIWLTNATDVLGAAGLLGLTALLVTRI